jgi:hypothetical protein
VNALRAALLAMDSTQSGRTILSRLGVSRFQVPPPDLFEYAHSVLADAKSLDGKEGG